MVVSTEALVGRYLTLLFAVTDGVLGKCLAVVITLPPLVIRVHITA